ncbi:secretion system protein E [Burkholderia vietnamiensis]|uniref:ATPase, T2SS/T4P/T4SS family n=1 Tax=Burkholderia vietnamiensis TaxID=60552 RepID=UPI0006225C99|nr:ATPase, T2SS/T4P/T4SS family [Burkholderia vietnamiensis]KKI39319.1 secretion system protein E [Burkholderia vietnamiensis]TPQ46987.1 secretion system protein E [Burkholderia ubonensis]HDR9086036.1 Flp pilus assembly complex ATPase component TadA [Burkholderia vietnamiensis]
MSFFSEVESPEPEKSSFFGRLKALKRGFVGSSPAAMPIVGREPTDGGETAHVFEPREPRSKTASKCVQPRHANHAEPMTMGMMLRRAQDEIEDVEVIGEKAAVSRQDTATEASAEPSEFWAPSASARTGKAPAPDDQIERGAEAAQSPSAAPDESMPIPIGEISADGAAVQHGGGSDEPPTVRRIGMDLAEAPELAIETGRPRLVSAESLTFKRVLCQRDPNAALAVSDAARREFIAVELQAGISIVVATQRFHDGQLYATYIKDLARADISIHEEMVADEEVIAALYSKEKQRTSEFVPEASRAIGVFRDVIEAATAYGAADVHWEYRDFAEDVELRLRVDGDLYTYRQMPKALVRRSLSAAYQDLVQRNTNSGETFQPTAPQSAMIPLVAHMDIVNIRWQSAPLVGGFDVALRLLDGNFKHVNVLLPHEMGLEASQLAIIENLGKVTGGATFLTGETGSAKTTLLRAMSYLVPNRDRIKQFAVNEPSEVPAPWLSDISIQRRPGESEEDANRKIVEVIRTLMRMDPDDLTIGEVRDSVLAGLVAELALTGHPVRATLHGNSILGAVMRLVGGRLKLPMDEVASGSFLNAVGNQKLIPKLCPHCKRPARDVLTQQQIATLERKFGLDPSTMACRDEDGCEHCRRPGLFTRSGKVAAGIKGQTLAMELYRPTPEFLERVGARDWRGAERVWRTGRKTGFADADMTGKTVYEHALYKASQGLIDPRFIDESMCAFDAYRVFPDSMGAQPS